MNKFLILFLFVFILFTNCKEAVVNAPKNLIEENKMVDILYDLSLLDAIKIQGNTNQQGLPSITEFLKKKYKIDSLTFSENSKYYASDITNYKKMYDRVKDRLNDENFKLNGVKPSEQMEEKGVVK